MVPGVTAAMCLFLAQATWLDPLLERLAEEAEVFGQSLDKIVGEEVIRQQAMKPKGPRLRIGEAAMREDPVEYQDRELRSEFGYAVIRSEANPAGSYHEARQVLEVDGKRIQGREKARRKLVLGLRSGDEEVKKRMLEDLERLGLRGAATDFSLCLLLFRRRSLGDYDRRRAGGERIGADAVTVFEFRQKRGDQAMTVFHGKESIRQSLSGRVWIRDGDGVPLKIRLISAIADRLPEPVLDIGEVEYTRGSSFVTLPVAAMHRRSRGALLLAEETFHYSGFKRFSADSEIKFTPVDEPLPGEPVPASPGEPGTVSPPQQASPPKPSTKPPE